MFAFVVCFHSLCVCVFVWMYVDVGACMRRWVRVGVCMHVPDVCVFRCAHVCMCLMCVCLGGGTMS